MEPDMSNIDSTCEILRRQYSLDFQFSWESDRFEGAFFTWIVHETN